MSNVKRQYLTLPFNMTNIEAGFKNPTYLKNWKYNHLGIDCVSTKRNYTDNILASGIGKVLTIGRDNRVGNVIAIQYYNVYNHKTGQVCDVTARYMHLKSISVKVNQEVNSNTVLGVMGGTGITDTSYAIHLHLEFDTDINHPNYSGQVSGGTIFKSGTSNTMINPVYLLHVGKNQKVGKLINAWVISEDTCLPTYKEVEYMENTNYQKLILPVNNMLITASYKNKKYETLRGNTSTGFMGIHYGMDFCNDLQLWGSGNGTVVKTGTDACFGNFIVIKYENVFNHALNKIHDVVLRYFHLSSVSVKTGDKITTKTKLGIMGMTGAYATGIHTHLEADLDIEHWQYTPTLIGSTTYFRAGTRGTGDTTFNPLDVMYIKTTAPDNQKLRITNDGYSNAEDANTPKL